MSDLAHKPLCLLVSTILILSFNPNVHAKSRKSGKETKVLASESGSPLRDRVQKILNNSKLSLSDVGLVVGESESDEVLFSHNSEKKFIPASITKLATAAAVLHYLPPGTKFSTQLLANTKPEKGTLNGDLYFKGGGDPGFVSENMWFLVNAFVRSGITEISGDIVVDDSLFDSSRFDQTRQKERVDRAYDAPTGALSFNWNSVNVFVRPNSKEGEPARVFIDPENDYIELKGQVGTGSSKAGNSVSVEREDHVKPEKDIIRVGGKIGVGHGEVVVFKNITRPDYWAGFNLKSFLAQRGIKVRGQVRPGQTPDGAQLLAESESKPIESAVADMNKFSNNYVAEMLTKSLGLQVSRPGTIDKGMQKIKEFLNDQGLGAKDFELFNPSGLTRNNKMTPHAFLKVLREMRRQYPYAPEFMVSLPIAGVDGTLKKRMKGSRAERWVRAKTGFLTGVVSLAGYAGQSDGSVLPFVMIYNGGADESRVRAVFDKIAEALVE